MPVTLWRNRFIAGMITLAATALTACGGSPPPTTAPVSGTLTPQREVLAFTAEQADPYLTIANADGVTPCGVFDVRGHGDKSAELGDYPACSATNFSVYCLNGEAEWENSFVSNTSYDALNRTLTFTSAQDGICAIFPSP